MNRDFVLISKSWNYSIFYNPLQTLTMLSYQSFFKSILQKILQNFKNHSELWKINQSNVRFFLFVFFFFLFFFSIVLILKEYNIVKSIGQSNQLRGEKRYLTSFQPFSFSLDLSSFSSSSEQLYKEEKKIGKQILVRAKNRSR